MSRRQLTGSVLVEALLIGLIGSALGILAGLGLVRLIQWGMDAAGFGNCTNHYECMEACPKHISVEFIAQLNRDYSVHKSNYDQLVGRIQERYGYTRDEANRHLDEFLAKQDAMPVGRY